MRNIDLLKLYLCLFVIAASAQAETRSSAQLDQAEQFFSAALYARAIPIYRQMLGSDELTPEQKLLARRHLTQAYFYEGSYAEAIALLNSGEQTPEKIYLLGVAYSKLGEYDNGIVYLEKYLSNPQPLANEAIFELGVAAYLSQRYDVAEKQFSLLSNTQDSRLRYLAHLYLSRVAMARHDLQKAEKILQSLRELTPDNPLLRYEYAYLLGELSFYKEAFSDAIRHFSESLPKNSPEKAPWYKEAKYRLALSYLKQKGKKQVDEAVQILTSLKEQFNEERILLALGQAYLIQAKNGADPAAYKRAEALLIQPELAFTSEARSQALLLLAEGAPTYQERNVLYTHLIQTTPKGWYLRGINHLDEGIRLAKAGASTEALKMFEHAATDFGQAFAVLYLQDPTLAGKALKQQIYAYLHQDTPGGYENAVEAVESFLRQHRDLLQTMDDPDEVFYLYAVAAKHHSFEKVQRAWNELKIDHPTGKFADKLLHLLGTLQYERHEYADAESTFIQIAANFPDSLLAAEALLHAAVCADKQGEAARCKEHRRSLFEKFSKSPYAAEAYFFYYSYADYAQGERAAIKHLQTMAEKYPETPFLIHAWYLIGMDYKRDRKTETGKWIRKKNPMAAIDAFQASEAQFETLFREGKLEEAELDLLATIRYRALLERAMANLEIADQSQGAKKHIYLEYAEEELKQLIAEFRNKEHPLKEHIKHVAQHEHLEEESLFWLAEAYIKANKDVKAEQTLSQMLEKYQSAKITRGYYLSRTYYDLGMIATRRGDHEAALQNFRQAEDAAKGNVLGTDQKLDLWIQQGLSYQALNELDNAILIFSKVVNDDAISGLRIKAMYLRAGAYELQGRRDLARKQLDAVAHKQGEWAVKAQERLNKDYGYK